MRLRQVAVIVAVVGTTFFAGCVLGGGNSEPFSDNYSDQDIKLFVTNLAFSDVTLYGIINGGRRRLGRITGKKENVFILPYPAPFDMYLEIDFLAGPTCLTEKMIVDPGDHLDLIIQNENRSWSCRDG